MQIQRQVGPLMDPAVLIVNEKTSIKGVARAMSEHSIRTVVVVDDQGAPVGLLTGMDLLRQWGKDIENIPASQAMTRRVMSVAATADLREAVEKMIASKVHRLIVCAGTEPPEAETCRVPVGLISTHDIVQEMARPGSMWWPQK